MLIILIYGLPVKEYSTTIFALHELSLTLYTGINIAVPFWNVTVIMQSMTHMGHIQKAYDRNPSDFKTE